jgi:hypothetical protein
MKNHLALLVIGSFLGCGAANAQTNTLPHVSINGPDSSQIESGFVFSWPDASVTSPLDGEVIAPLRQNEPAPFTGLLFSPPAVARVAATTRADRQICRVTAETQYNLLLALANRNLALAANDHQLNVERAQIRIDRLNIELEEMRTRTNIGMFTYLGIAGGIIISGLVGYAFGTLLR